MARISELPLKFRLFLLAYPFRTLDPVPWTRPARPLGDCRIALITTAAFYAPEQEPFDESRRGGDFSYRVLPTRTSDGEPHPVLDTLLVGHRSSAFDAEGIATDSNLAIPVEPLLDLENRGVVGHLHEEALSFMGSITAPGRLVKITAPEAAERLAGAGVDVALLTPV